MNIVEQSISRIFKLCKSHNIKNMHVFSSVLNRSVSRNKKLIYSLITSFPPNFINKTTSVAQTMNNHIYNLITSLSNEKLITYKRFPQRHKVH